MSILDNLARLGRASMQQKERAYSKEAPELGGIFDNPASLLDKYVQDGTQNFNSAAADPREYAERSNTAMAGDVLGSMTTGAVNATFGGAKLAAQTGDDTGILGTFRDFNNWVGDQKSDALKANLEDKAAYDADVDAQIDALVANGEMTQGEAEWKRLKSKVGSYNVMTAGDTGAGALGSTLAIVGTRGKLRGAAIGASGASALAETTDNVADELYEKDPLGQYVLGHEALMDSSKDYAHTYQKTGDEKAARDAVFVEASNAAATDPVAIATSAFEMFADSLLPGAKQIPKAVKRSLIGSVVNSVVKQPVKNAAKTIATEMPSEVIGGAGRRIASNRAAEEQGLGERDLLQGTGGDAAEAIVGSIGSGAAPAMSRAIQLTRVAAGVTAAVGSSVFGKGDKAEEAKPDLTTKANNAFKAAAEPLQAAQAEVDAMPEGEDKTKRAALLESIGSELIWDDIPEGAAPESIRTTLNGSAHKAEAVDKAVQGILEGKHTPFEVANLLAFVQEATSSLEVLSQQLDSGQLDIEDDSNILGAIESFRSIRDVIQNDENISKGMEAAHSLIANIDATIDQNKPMAEQQEQIDNLLAKVQVAPETLDEASVSYAIDNAAELSLDNNQVEKLKFIRDALGLQRELDQYNADQGHNKAIDIVSREVKSDLDKGSKGLSVMGHADRVMSMARSGNTEGAKKQLTQLANFTKSQLNKLNALKASQKSGNAETYKTVGAGLNKFVDSKTGVTYSAPVFADTIQAEAQFLATIHNQLAEAFPDLGMPVLPVPAKFEHNIAKPKSKGQATPTPKADSGTTAVNDIINTANNPVEEVVEAPAAPATKKETTDRVSEAAAKRAASLSDEELNDALNSMDPKDPAFAAYDNEMNRREDAAQEQNEIEQREEQVLEPKQVPVSPEEPIEGEVTVMRKGKPHVYTKRGGKVFNSKGKEIIDPRIVKLFDPVVEEEAEPVVKEAEPSKEESLEDLVETPERVKPSKLKADAAKEAVAEVVEEPTITAEEILNPDSPEVIEEVDATVDEAAAALPNMVKTTFGKLVDVIKDSSLIHATLSGMRTVYEAMVGSDNATVKAYANVYGNVRKDNIALLAGLDKTLLAQISGIKFDKATGYTKNEFDKLQANKANMSKEEYDAAYRALQFNVARRYDKRQLLNLYEYDPATHTLTMPDEVMAAATAAIVQYTAAFANEIPSYTNPEDVAKAFGIDLSVTTEDGLPLALYIRSQGGVTGRMVKERLAGLAMEFLGVRIKGDSRIGQVEGAMQSLMATLMANMIKENGHFDTIKVPVQIPNDKGVLINTNVTVLVPNQGFKDSNFGQELNSNPDIMKNLLLQNRERPRYIGVLPKVARKKMRSLTGKINKRQQDIIDFNQKIPFFRNSDMMNVYTEMFTEEGLLELFGDPEANDPDSPMNVYDRIAKEGNNNQISGAFNDLIVLSREIKDYADGSGTSVDDTPVYYSSAFTSVSRLQMGGSYNPQGNKTVRSVMSPNKSQVDLSNFESKINSGDTNLTDHELFYALAMAQALGIKVHNNTHEQTVEQLGKLLKGKIKPAIDMWASKKGTKLNSADLQLLKDTLGGDLSNLAIQVINEYTQLQGSKDKSKFTTYNYIEADGITNGPFIAGLILGADIGSPSWVEYMANGGLYIGQDINSNEYRSKEIAEKRLPDNYLLTAQKGNENVNQVFKEDLSSGWPEEFETHALYMHNLMTNVFGHITMDPNTGDIIMSRNTSKNPMTVTIYGSGVRGVAGKFAEEVVSLVHEISTASLKYGKDAPQHLYPELTKEEAELKFNTVRNALIEATSKVNVIYKDKNGQMKAFTANNGYGLDLSRAGVNTTVTAKQLETLTTNLQRYLAAPLVKGARSVSGRVMDNSETLAKASNIHSGLIQATFLVELQNMLNDLVAESKTGTKDVRLKDFLTPNEIIGLHKQMEEYGVSIEALGQIFSLAKTEKGTVQGINLETGQGANGEFASSSPSIENPTQLGVGGVPRAVIGFGDGATIMSFLESIRKSGVSDKLLQVFDGINLSADNFREGSKLANEAVMNAVMADPLTSISDSLSAGIPKLLIKLGLVELGIDGQYDLTKVAQGTWEGVNEHLGNSAVGTEILFKIANPFVSPKTEIKTPADFVTEALVQMNMLADAAKENKQNQKVLAGKLWSIDQMAAVGEQGTNKGEKLGNTTNVGVALELAAALNEANKPKPKGDYKKPVVLETESGFKNKKETRSLFKELLATVDGLTDSDKNLFTRILVASEKAGVKLFTGTNEEINKDHIPFPTSANGAYDHETNTVYLSKADLTTLMHELTHGVTTATLIEYFTGDRKNVSKEAQLAIQNLDKLLDQFLAGLEVDTHEQDVTQKRYIEYIKTTAIRAHAQGGNKLGRAKAISEMIAIVATNKEMREVAKKAKNNTQLARIVGSIVDVAKAILGLPKTRGSGFDLHTSFFDAVYTNTNIIMDFQINQSATAKVTAETDFSIDSDPQGIIKDTLVNVVGSMETVLERDRAEASIQESGNIARETGDAAMAAGFKMDQGQIDAFEAAHTLLGAAIPMDADIRSGINKLVRQAIKELKPEDFLRTKNPTDTDIMDAESKYNYVTGSTSKRNKQGRSSLVPTFVALSMTNKEFAEVLGKLKTKAVANNGKTIDESLSKFGYSAMNRLSNSVNKIDKAKNIPDNLKSMYGELLKKIEGGHTKYDAFVIPVGNAVDKANAILSDGLGKLGKALHEQGSAMSDTESKAATAFGALLSITGAIIDKESAGAVAEGLTSLLNKTNIPSGIKYTIRDMIGRTESSARIYDLIKPIRSFVQKQRQMYVDGTPENIIKNFTKAPTAEQWSDLTNSMAKTGLGLLANMHGIDAALSLIASDGALTTRLNTVRKELRLAQPELYQQMEAKADQLATYMNTGVTGGNLLRNAYEIAGLFGTDKVMLPDSNTVKIIDELATLKALKGTNLTTLRRLAKSEAKGIRYTLSFLQGQIKEESKKGSDITGGFKGYIPATTKGSVVVISDKDAAEYTAKGYVRVGDYVSSRLDKDRSKRGYYYSPLDSSRPFAQGIIQNVLLTKNGVNLDNGYAVNGSTVGSVTIDDSAVASSLQARMNNDPTAYGLIPIYGWDGTLQGYERAIDPAMQSKLQVNNNLAEMLGVWRGRQSEEFTANQFNRVIVDELMTSYKEASDKSDFVDILDKGYLSTNPVLADAVRVMSKDVKEYANELGGKLFVRKDMIENVTGYRSMTVANIFDGITGMNPELRTAIKDGLEVMMGKKAYYYMVRGDEILRGLVGDVKQLIVVKSVVVPAINTISNIVHMVGRGVPIKSIATGMRSKLVEIETYSEMTKRLIEIESDMRANTNNIPKIKSLQAERTIINETISGLTIYPLIQAGEFSSIVSVQIDSESNNLHQGKIAEYMEGQIAKLNPLGQDVAKNLLITKDTSIYQFLQKATDYGDFIAKAIIYDDIIKRKGGTKKEALIAIKEEFINYDYLPGRVRGSLEGMGLLWFYNFKLRSVKIALSMIRENPLHTLLAAGIPSATPFGNIGLPINDNVFYKLGEGSLPSSIGPSQGLGSWKLHPWVNITN